MSSEWSQNVRKLVWLHSQSVKSTSSVHDRLFCRHQHWGSVHVGYLETRSRWNIIGAYALIRKKKKKKGDQTHFLWHIFPTARYSLGLKLSIPIMIYLSTSIVCKFFFDVGSHNPLSRSWLEIMLHFWTVLRALQSKVVWRKEKRKKVEREI